MSVQTSVDLRRLFLGPLYPLFGNSSLSYRPEDQTPGLRLSTYKGEDGYGFRLWEDVSPTMVREYQLSLSRRQSRLVNRQGTDTDKRTPWGIITVDDVKHVYDVVTGHRWVPNKT